MKNECVELPEAGLEFVDSCQGMRLPVFDLAGCCLSLERPDENDDEWDRDEQSDQPYEGGKGDLIAGRVMDEDHLGWYEIPYYLDQVKGG